MNIQLFASIACLSAIAFGAACFKLSSYLEKSEKKKNEEAALLAESKTIANLIHQDSEEELSDIWSEKSLPPYKNIMQSYDKISSSKGIVHIPITRPIDTTRYSVMSEVSNEIFNARYSLGRPIKESELNEKGIFVQSSNKDSKFELGTDFIIVDGYHYTTSYASWNNKTLTIWDGGKVVNRIIRAKLNLV
jgi:hypothetical protein